MYDSVKRCTMCGEHKTTDEFYYNKSADCWSSQCRVCSRKRQKERYHERVVAKRLDIPFEEAVKFAKMDREKCEICGTEENLHYDHCHTTKKARGILCFRCNTFLGRIGDTYAAALENLKPFLEYLEKNDA